MSLLLLGVCEGLLPSENNPPAVVPNPQPGAPIPGGLRIVSVHASPLNPDMMSWKPGTVNVRFNGAATMPGVVEVSAREPGWQLYTRVGTAKFFPGQTDLQVPIKVSIRPNDEPAEVPFNASPGCQEECFRHLTRRLQFDKRRRLCIRAHDETLSTAAICILLS